MTLDPSKHPLWGEIDTVLLDLDGTLLDLAFDNYLWLQCVPAAYAAARGMSSAEALAALIPRFRAWEGRLEWYCIEHWSRELDLDIAAMHHRERGHVRWLPGAQDFLKWLERSGKRRALVTNAHPETLRIKDAQTGVTGYFDAVYSSHASGAPKEDPRFWEYLQRVEPYDRNRALFVDDSATVLRAGKAAGIRWIYAIRRQPGVEAEFATIDSVAQLSAAP